MYQEPYLLDVRLKERGYTYSSKPEQVWKEYDAQRKVNFEAYMSEYRRLQSLKHSSSFNNQKLSTGVTAAQSSNQSYA